MFSLCNPHPETGSFGFGMTADKTEGTSRRALVSYDTNCGSEKQKDVLGSITINQRMIQQQ